MQSVSSPSTIKQSGLKIQKKIKVNISKASTVPEEEFVYNPQLA